VLAHTRSLGLITEDSSCCAESNRLNGKKHRVVMVS